MSKEIRKDTTIADILECPDCDSENTDIMNTDEIEFGYDGTGHYYVDCFCHDCKRHFRKYMHFRYQITSYH